MNALSNGEGAVVGRGKHDGGVYVVRVLEVGEEAHVANVSNGDALEL